MRVKLTIVVQHDSIFSDTDSVRKLASLSARPAASGLFARKPSQFGIVKILVAAKATVNNSVAKPNHLGSPLAFRYSAILRIANAVSESLSKQVSQRLRINGPKS